MVWGRISQKMYIFSSLEAGAGMWVLWMEANLSPSYKFSRPNGHFRLGRWEFVPVRDLLSAVQGKGFPSVCWGGGRVVSNGKWVCGPDLRAVSLESPTGEVLGSLL